MSSKINSVVQELCKILSKFKRKTSGSLMFPLKAIHNNMQKITEVA